MSADTAPKGALDFGMVSSADVADGLPKVIGVARSWKGKGTWRRKPMGALIWDEYGEEDEVVVVPPNCETG